MSRDDALVVLQSPLGLKLCLAPHRGASVRPGPVGEPTSRVDQISLDLPSREYDHEVQFWTELTGWARLAGRLPEFELLTSPDGMPVRILLQRLILGGTCGAHVDLATSDRATSQVQHRALGAAVTAMHEYWTVMRDPAGGVYCLTDRDPQTGSLRSS
jgi:hypothetical protein